MPIRGAARRDLPPEREPVSGCIDYRADGSQGTYINVRLDESTIWDSGRRAS